ncbi:MAG: beta/gamma crystallin-related protein [Cyanobacteriota bacterium]
MSNINQTQDLFALDTVQDLDNETAATCSGGAGYLNSGDPDVILFEHERFQGRSLNLNAATGDGLRNFGTWDGNGGGGDNGFNDVTTSIQVLRGTWEFFTSSNYGGESLILGPGSSIEYVGSRFNDRFTSAFRRV